MANIKATSSQNRFIRKEFIQGVSSILFLIALVYVGMRVIPLDNVSEKVANAGVYGVPLFLLLKAATIIVAPLSGNPLYLTAAPLFGFRNGFTFLFIGDIVGCTVAFYLSRFFGKNIIKVFFSDKQLKQLDSLLHDFGTFRGLILLGVAFLSFSDIVSYGAGLTMIPFWKFLLIVIPGMLIKITLLMVIGEAFVKSSNSFLVVIAVITLAPLAFIFVRRLLKRGT